jgi:hypothetical protein
MTTEKLVETFRKLLRTDQDLDFLLKLDTPDLEKLVVLVRDRLDHAGPDQHSFHQPRSIF